MENKYSYDAHIILACSLYPYVLNMHTHTSNICLFTVKCASSIEILEQTMNIVQHLYSFTRFGVFHWASNAAYEQYTHPDNHAHSHAKQCRPFAILFSGGVQYSMSTVRLHALYATAV